MENHCKFYQGNDFSAYDFPIYSICDLSQCKKGVWIGMYFIVNTYLFIPIFNVCQVVCVICKRILFSQIIFLAHLRFYTNCSLLPLFLILIFSWCIKKLWQNVKVFCHISFIFHKTYLRVVSYGVLVLSFKELTYLISDY